jgi:hypothetical protein
MAREVLFPIGMKTLAFASLSLALFAACAHSSSQDAPPRGPDFVANRPANRGVDKPLVASDGKKAIDPLDVVDFDLASADLTSSAQTQIQRSIEFLANHPAERIVLEGHTDRSGTTAYNKDLATLRAVNVRDAMLAAGIKADRVIISVFGEDGADPGVNFYDRRVVMFTSTHSTMDLVRDEIGKQRALSVTYDDQTGRHVVMVDASTVGER